MEAIISNNIKTSSYLANGQAEIHLEWSNDDICFSKKGSHTQIHYIIHLIKTVSL